MVRHCGCPPGCDHPWALGRAHVLSSPDIHCANTMALSVLVVMVLAGMVTSNGDAGAAKVFVGSSRAPPKLPSTWGCVPTPIVSEPRSTTIHIWYVTAVDPKLKVGLAVHVPLNMVLNAIWDGLVPNPALYRSEEHTSELQSLAYLVCRLLLEKKKKKVKNEANVLPTISLL